MAVAGDEIERLYRRGFSCAATAAILGCGGTSVYNRLKAAGVEMRPRSDANRCLPDHVFKRLYNIGLSSSQIARLLGVHPTTVVKRLDSCSFPMRPRRTAAAIAYTEDEFERFFCASNFIEALCGLLQF